MKQLWHYISLQDGSKRLRGDASSKLTVNITIMHGNGKELELYN